MYMYIYIYIYIYTHVHNWVADFGELRGKLPGEF